MEQETYWILKYRKHILWAYLVLTVVALLAITQIRFGFSFEQFFPKGDPELEFFKEFTSDFETDDNFMLVAIKSDHGVFSERFINELVEFSAECKTLPHVTSVQSLGTMKIPQLSPFGFRFKQFLRSNPESDRLQDSINIMSSPKLRNSLISKDGDAMLVLIKHNDNIGMGESKELMNAFSELWQSQDHFSNYHLLGRAYFQDELASLQQREIIMSSVVSILLVSIIFFFLYRQRLLILVSLTTIALGMLLFVGALSLFGREFNGISALYPVLMLIVGTSDVVHIVSKYVDMMLSGKSKSESLKITVNEIGLATFLTSATTAAGFMSLMTSRIGPIQEFGMNSAFGVVMAYGIVVTFTLAAISFIPREQIRQTKFQGFWNRMMEHCYRISLTKEKQIAIISVLLLVVFGIGISKISTNYDIESNLPRGAKVTEDFLYFEDQFSGFRPFEFAIQIKQDQTAYSPQVVKELYRFTEHLSTYEEVGDISSIVDVYQGLQSSISFGLQDSPLPSDSILQVLQPLMPKLPNPSSSILVNKDMTKTRVTSKINDFGADNILVIGEQIDSWVNANLDTTLLNIRRTGTGVILDRNAEYVRMSLLQGMGLALLIVVVIMTFLFKDIKMLFVSLLPNVLPLLFAAALLGYADIKLEATISIIFTIVFGIAVDDTIHFLSKYKIALGKGLGKEEAIRATFLDTGKAITFTTIILFFGFLVLLFSIHPPSNVIGVLISVTLISALLADFFILPMLLRRL